MGIDMAHIAADSALPKKTWLAEVRRAYFSNALNGITTLVALSCLIWGAWQLLVWGVIESVWTSDAQTCQSVGGACWSVVYNRWRVIMFGLYPSAEQWRSAIACLAVVATLFMICLPRNWAAARMMLILFGGFAVFFLFMRGGIFGMDYVAPSRWGGLSLTLFIYITVISFGLPISIVLALARQSKYPMIRWIVSLVVDLTRSLPLVTILFSAALILPLVLPSFLEGDKLTRVLLAFSFFFGCYQSENIRAGMQALGKGQSEAADALGLNYWQRMAWIILPQAFRISMPATINQFVVTFKETSLVVIVGLFDLMASARAAYQTGQWTPYYKEVYIFVAAIYFIGAFSLSRYGAYLERRMSVSRR